MSPADALAELFPFLVLVVQNTQKNGNDERHGYGHHRGRGRQKPRVMNGIGVPSTGAASSHVTLAGPLPCSTTWLLGVASKSEFWRALVLSPVV